MLKSIIKTIKRIVPLTVRKKIKSYLGKFITPAKEEISPIISKELKHNYSKDILIFSVISWNSRIQRPQHLSQKLAKLGYRIFYIDHELLPHLNPFSNFSPIQINKIENNIYNIKLSASRELFIYNEKLSAIDKKILLSSIKNLLYKATISNPIAIIDHPFWAQICDELVMPYIYDCMDNHSGFSENAQHNIQLEKTLFKQSDATIVTSKYLQQIAQKNHAKNITLIPNAGDYQHFSKLNKLSTPPDINSIPHPIIGYYGAIADWFDTEILEDIAKNHPDKSIVLIGLVSNPQVEKLAQKCNNIYLLGEKKYQELPSYLKEFDLCIIPFILNNLIKATHPVKIFEYFAAGKAVVSTKLPEIVDNKLIYFANKNNFSKQIDIALKNKDKDISKRQKFASLNTWEKRAILLNNLIQKIIFPKISVIILSYNHPDLMEKTIESVLNNSCYPNLEIIIVDNNSNQETINLLKKYQHHPQIKLIFNQKNLGFSAGNNIGLKAATGDYLILLNNDVIVTPGWLSRLLFHVRRPNVGLVGPVTDSIGNEAKIDFTIENYSQYTYLHWGQTLNVNNIAAFCWIMSRETYRKVGELDERFGRGMFEDDDYCKRVKKLGLDILIADDVFIHHFGAASFKQLTSKEYQELFNENREKFESKWHSKWIPHQYRK